MSVHLTRQKAHEHCTRSNRIERVATGGKCVVCPWGPFYKVVLVWTMHPDGFGVDAARADSEAGKR